MTDSPSARKECLFLRRPGKGRYAAWAIGGALLLLVPLASTASAAPSWDPAPTGWTNGFVMCEFSPTLPTVSVSAVERVQSGLSTTVASVAEVDPSGQTVAVATVSGSNWTATNVSNDDVYDLAYTLAAPVSAATGSEAPLGTASLSVDYVLPVYAGGTGGSVDTVQVDFEVSDWPWQSANDHLVLSFDAWPSFSTQERLDLTSSPGSLMTSVSARSGAALEQMGADAFGTANPASSHPVHVPAVASVSGNVSGATVAIAFSSSAGAFSTLNYSASVTVLFPATIAGIPTIDLVAVGAAAALISILVAVGVRKTRSRPSDLTFVDEKDP
jgi:hypothetical protein